MKTKEMISVLRKLDPTGEQDVTVFDEEPGPHSVMSIVRHVKTGAPFILIGDSTRSMGCSECSADMPVGTPFIHHETDGSWGGPWCMRCAIETMGFGSADLAGNFHYHPPEET